MKKENVENAKYEAKRFLKACENLVLDKSSWALGDYQPGKAPAAVKRASLDLSMALTRVRTR